MHYEIEFQYLKVKNARTYKDKVISLHNQGIVSILGSNGVGKSTIWNLLEAAIYGSTPDGQRRDELSKRKKQETILEVFLRRGKYYFNVSYSRSKSGKWSHTICRFPENNDCIHQIDIDEATKQAKCTKCGIQGFDETNHTAQAAANASAKILGINQKEFEGSIHLTQNKQHILISGKPTERKKYISDFFGIDDSYDFIQDKCKAELDRVKKEISNLSGLSHTKQVLEEELKEYPYVDTSPYVEQRTNYNSRLKKLQDQKIQLNSEIADIEEYNRLLPLVNMYNDPKSLKSDLNEELIQARTRITSIDEKKRENAQIEINNKKIDELESLIFDLKQDQYVNYYSQYDVSVLQTRSQQLSSSRDQYNSILKYIKELKNIEQSVSNLELKDVTSLEKNKSELDNKALLLSNKISSIENGTCPTCGAQYHDSDLNVDRSKLNEYQKEITSLKSSIEDYQKHNDLVRRIQELKEITSAVPEFSEDMNRELTILLEVVPKLQNLINYEGQLRHLERRDIHDIPDEKSLNTRISEIQEQLKKIDQCLLAHQNLPHPPSRTIDEVQSESDRIHQNVLELENTINNLNVQLGNIESSNQRHERISSQLKNISDDLNKLPELKQEEIFWAKMVDAYGNKGLRVLQLEKIMGTVMERFPYYASILFQEKGLEFKFKCDSGNINILAVRTESQDGKEITFEHDISSLSGGEQKRASVAFILTLADCITAQKRANLLILDEIDTNLDEAGQFLFVNDLLPELKQNYASIFLISHSKDIRQAAVYDQEWYLSKKNHWTDINQKILSQTMD